MAGNYDSFEEFTKMA